MRKKILLLLMVIFYTGLRYASAQCYGTVVFDTSTFAGVVANAGNTSFTIPTKYPNELIMIAYDGWNGPGLGPVTVDGNPAKWINTANNGNSGSAMTYAYSAPLAGTHNIVCATSGWNSGYYINMAAAFYATGSCTPLSPDSLTSTINTIACTTGGSITDNITTTRPNAMIFTNCEINEGQPTSYPISWTAATFLANEHTEDGIDAGEGYASAAVAGTYTITATNSSNPSNGCGGLTIVLTAIQPPVCSGGPMTYSNSLTNPVCNNINGTVTVTPTSGSGPYTYLWSPGGYTTQTVTGLSAGTYTVSITDASCDYAVDTVILKSSAPVVTVAPTGIIKCNGDATAGGNSIVTGGSSPYTYNWSPSGGTNATATNLSAGTYTLTVTDNTGCATTASITVTQPAVLKGTQTINNVLCNGGNSGKVVTSVSGGTGSYSYAWSPIGGSNATASNLSAGTYTLTITDSNGCITHDTAIVKQPAVLGDSIAITDATCKSNNGVLSTTVSGGTGPYTYSWSPSGGTKGTASNLSVGSYTVTITDANGCTKTATGTVKNINAPSITGSGTMLKCYGDNNGSATVTVSGGTTPYTYAWAPAGGINATASNLSAGTYTCTVTDGNGCVIVDTITITEPAQLKGTLSSTTGSCEEPNGSLNVNASGGTGGYNYSWSPGGSTAATITGVSAGSYTCTVTDGNGCVTTDTVSVGNKGVPPSYIACCDTTIAPGDSAGLNTLPILGGVVYSWSPGNGLSCSGCPDPVATPTVTTTYTVVVTDSNGCTTTRTITVTVEIPCSDFIVPNVFTPNDDGINDDFVIRVENPSSYSINIYDRWGKEVYKSTDATKFWNGKYNNTDYVVPDGVYYYVIKATCGTNSYAKDGFVHLISGRK